MVLLQVSYSNKAIITITRNTIRVVKMMSVVNYLIALASACLIITIHHEIILRLVQLHSSWSSSHYASWSTHSLLEPDKSSHLNPFRSFPRLPYFAQHDRRRDGDERIIPCDHSFNSWHFDGKRFFRFFLSFIQFVLSLSLFLSTSPPLLKYILVCTTIIQ